MCKWLGVHCVDCSAVWCAHIDDANCFLSQGELFGLSVLRGYTLQALRILPSTMHAVPQDGGTTPGRVFYYVTQLEAVETTRIHRRLPMEPAAAASSEQYWGLREAHIVQKRLKRRR